MVEVLKRIVRVRKAGPGVTQVQFESGEAMELDWKRLAKPGTVFERLDDPTYSTKCRKVLGGFALRWPDGLDLSAASIFRYGRQLDPQCKRFRDGEPAGDGGEDKPERAALPLRG